MMPRLPVVWLACVALLASAAGPARATLSLASIERGVLADASAISASDSGETGDAASSSEPGVFDQEILAPLALDRAVVGGAQATQQTTIGPLLIGGEGTTSSAATSTDPIAITDFAAESFLRVTFSVAQPTRFVLEAALSSTVDGLGDAFVGLDLTSGSDVLFSQSLTGEDEADFDLVGELLPDRVYELLAISRGVGEPLGASSGAGGGRFEFAFAVPEPRPAALLALGLLIGSRPRRRGGERAS